MISKTAHWSKSSSLKHSECGDDISELRKKLTSVGWIQCDNPFCLKWRKVRLEVAQLVKEDTRWTCNMNDDTNCNRCSVPEEDTSLYDKLAKKVNLNIITSKLKPGSLVWAKVYGYCRWPALVTADPLNGEYLDENECEVLQYHVEFLGKTRSHGWVKTNFIEVFGLANIYLPTEDKFASSLSKIKKVKAKKSNKMTSSSKVKPKEGSHKVQKAVQEALQLLPLQCEARLKTCVFVTPADVYHVNSSRKSLRSGKIKGPKIERRHTVRKRRAAQDNRCSNKKSTNMKLCYRNEAQTGTLSLCPDTESITENVGEISTRGLAHGCKCEHISERGSSVSLISGYLYTEVKKQEFLVFPSQLLNTSKEERFMQDVQMYQQNECVFEQKLALFMLEWGLTQPDVPTWQNIQVSKFSIFLAVLERDGFDKVCEHHLWPSVYTEVTHQHCKLGGGMVNRFYRRNLYPFELYINGRDYTAVVKKLHGRVKKFPKKVPVKEAGDSGVDTDDLEELIDEDDSFDSPDVVKHLDELDQILKSLESRQEMEYDDEDNKNQVVPVVDFPAYIKNCSSDDVPISKHSADVQVLHEMQALQYDLDLLQDQIDSL